MLKRNLAQEFEFKDLKRLKHLLGIEVAYSKEGIFMSQQKYVLDLLKETRMIGCKPIGTLMEPNKKLGKTHEEIVVE